MLKYHLQIHTEVGLDQEVKYFLITDICREPNLVEKAAAESKAASSGQTD